MGRTTTAKQRASIASLQAQHVCTAKSLTYTRGDVRWNLGDGGTGKRGRWMTAAPSQWVMQL